MTESKELTIKDPIAKLLTENKKAIESVLPKHITLERMLRLSYQAFGSIPKLRQCTPESIITSLLSVAKYGGDIEYNAHIIPFEKTPYIIEDYVRIAIGVLVLPGVRIEKNAFVGAGALVTKDVPENVIVFGVPAKVVGEVPKEERL